MTAPLPPKKIAELKALMEKAAAAHEHSLTCAVYDECPVIPAQVARNVALVKAAPALIAAAERVGAANITASRLVACELRQSKYVLRAQNAEARIAELEAALAKEKEKNDAAVMAAIDLFAANATWGKHAGMGCCAKSRCEGGVRDDLITAANNSLRRVLGIAGGDDRVVKRINEINDKREALAAEEGA